MKRKTNSNVEFKIYENYFDGYDIRRAQYGILSHDGNGKPKFFTFKHTYEKRSQTSLEGYYSEYSVEDNAVELRSYFMKKYPMLNFKFYKSYLNTILSNKSIFNRSVFYDIARNIYYNNKFDELEPINDYMSSEEQEEYDLKYNINNDDIQ